MNSLHLHALENPVMVPGQKPDFANSFGFVDGKRKVRITIAVDGVLKKWIVVTHIFIGSRPGLMLTNQVGDGLRRKILNAVTHTLSMVGDGPVAQEIHERSVAHFRALSEKEIENLGRVARPETVEAV